MTTTARLSFWIPAERMDELAETYAKRLGPILRRHDLEEVDLPPRRGADGVFSRLFEVGTPGEIPAREHALEQDPAWAAVLAELGTASAAEHPDGVLPFSLRLYSTSAGQGTTTEIGHGSHHGLWHSFGSAWARSRS